ncbi:MAG: hypothetical protein H5U40_12900, partial [Polyangiaceae bacterium]|nr:hypothetical protein [Polyangiaceae bacterium]
RALRKDLNERFKDMEAFGLSMRLAAHAANIDVRPELLPRVRSVPPGTPSERAERRRSERPPASSELPPSRGDRRAIPKEEMPTVQERIPPMRVPRFELDIPAAPRPNPPERSRPGAGRGEAPLELDIGALRAAQERRSGVAGGRAMKRTTGWAAFSGWFENAPDEVRKIVRLLFLALLVSMSYGAAMVLWRAL